MQQVLAPGHQLALHEQGGLPPRARLERVRRARQGALPRAHAQGRGRAGGRAAHLDQARRRRAHAHHRGQRHRHDARRGHPEPRHHRPHPARSSSSRPTPRRAKSKDDGAASSSASSASASTRRSWSRRASTCTRARCCPGAEPVLWRSTGAGTLHGRARANASTPAPKIVLHLKEDAREYAKAWRIKEIIRKYSDFVQFPIHVNDELANRSAALWTLPKSQVTDEQHTEFFRHVTAATRARRRSDACTCRSTRRCSSTRCSTCPRRRRSISSSKDRRGLRLYAKRVLIVEDCDKLTPTYLRFLRGVVDSEDLSLNVSREMLQEDKTLAQIEQQLTKQVLKALKELSESDADQYLKLLARVRPGPQGGHRGRLEEQGRDRRALPLRVDEEPEASSSRSGSTSTRCPGRRRRSTTSPGRAAARSSRARTSRRSRSAATTCSSDRPHRRVGRPVAHRVRQAAPEERRARRRRSRRRGTKKDDEKAGEGSRAPSRP